MKKTFWILLILLCVLTGFSLYSDVFEKMIYSNRYRAISFEHYNTAVYDSIFIALPAGDFIKGIDISHHQGRIDWQRLKRSKDSIRFVLIKATEGAQYTDPLFDNNWMEAKKAGLKCGAYHFFRADRPIADQISLYIRTVPLSKNDWIPVLDFEQTGNLSNDSINVMLKQWLFAIERHYRKQPVIYTNKRLYKSVVKPAFSHYPLWLAHYDTINPSAIKQIGDWQIWQLSDRAKINGIETGVDYNLMRNDSMGQLFLNRQSGVDLVYPASYLSSHY